MGSSPRVRGKLITALGKLPIHRLIPACAGKTADRHGLLRGQRAHPRVCGENGGEAVGFLGEPGSSPRVRGKLCWQTFLVCQVGLIPACAGKTVRGKTFCLNYWAHPRVCGENAASTLFRRRWTGSSPRVRGKQTLNT